MNISVIIPVYNAEEFLESSVKSANDLEEVQEIILIEDGSSDDSLIMAEKLSKQLPKVELYRHENGINKGAGASRNLGLQKANQEYVAFLDADDYYLPNRFKYDKELFKDSKVQGVFGLIEAEFIEASGKTKFNEKFKNNTKTGFKREMKGSEVLESLLGFYPEVGSFFHLNTLTLRRKYLEENCITFNENLRLHQDQDFIRKVAYHLYLKGGGQKTPIAKRRVHTHNRITQIKNYSSKFYKNLFALYESSYYWSKNLSMEKSLKYHIKLRYLSFKLANENGLKKWVLFLWHTLQNPKLLKTRYRFHIFKKHVEA